MNETIPFPNTAMTDDNSSIASSTTTSSRRQIFTTTVKSQYNDNDAPYRYRYSFVASPSNRPAARRQRSIAPGAQSAASSIASDVSSVMSTISINHPIQVHVNSEGHNRGQGINSNSGNAAQLATSVVPGLVDQSLSPAPPGSGAAQPQPPPPQKMSFEKQLFHQLHFKNINSHTIKEFNECWAFSNAVRSYFGKKAQFDVVIDVAGGHGALGALFLILTPAKRAVIIDPAEVGQNGIAKAWSDFYQHKELIYRHECLRTGLKDELDIIVNQMRISPRRVLVVACHACQHLSDETLEIACSYGVHAAVMPCCQKDLTGGSWKALGKSLGVGIGSIMDVLLAGKVSSWNSGKEAGVHYQVRMKTIDKKITPQNRIILCKAIAFDEASKTDEAKIAAHEKLERTYKKAHSRPRGLLSKRGKFLGIMKNYSFCAKSAVMGLVAGFIVSKLSRRQG